MYSTFRSHLKVHSHSPICSLFSNKGEWHIMVSSSWLIDYDLFSLRWKGWDSKTDNPEIKPQSVQFNQFQHIFLFLCWEIMMKHHIWKIAITNKHKLKWALRRKEKWVEYLFTDKSRQTLIKYRQLTAKTKICQGECLIYIDLFDFELSFLSFLYIYFFVVNVHFWNCYTFL